MKNQDYKGWWVKDGNEVDIKEINIHNNIPSFTKEEYNNETIVKKDFHICLDGTIINYFITDLDLQRKEITLEDKIQPNDFKKYEMELFRILDTEYKVVN